MHIPHLSRTIRHMPNRQQRLTEVAIVCSGAVLVIAALAANQSWLDRHFLSDFFIPRATQVSVETNIRIVCAAIGILMASVLRRALARFLTRDPHRTLYMAVAIAAAFLAAELTLRQKHLRAKEEVSA